MSNLDTINVGGIDYGIQDSTARTIVPMVAYNETGNTASQAYSTIGTPINWKGVLYYTTTTVAAGATWAVGTNLVAATNLGQMLRNIKTYVGTDSKLHFTDATGADSVLNFSNTNISVAELAYSASTGEGTIGKTVAVTPGYYLLVGWSFAASDATRTVTLSGGTNLLAKDASGFGYVRIRVVKCTATSTKLSASITCNGGNHRMFGYGIFRIVTGV